VNHQYFLWMSYGMTAIAVAVEVATLVVRRANALKSIEAERDLEAQD